jgi:ABC-2 type transport system permease protein
VYFRDVEFLIGVLLQAWFFVTPVIWPPSQAPESIKPWLLLNPISPFIRSYHQAIYDLRVPEAHLVGVCLLLGASMFLAGYAGFNRLKARIAEEL